jgi:hypothetical protein
LEQTIQFDTNLDYSENTVTSILFETKPGCSKTNFKFTDNYHKLNTQINNCFIASDFNEYENTIKKYFEMDYFKNITQEYFYDKYLIIVVLSANDGDYYKNGKFEKGSNNYFIYKIKLMDGWKPFLLRNKCTYTKITILNMNKNI